MLSFNVSSKRKRIEKHSKSGNDPFHSIRKLLHQNHSLLNNNQKMFAETTTYWLTRIDVCILQSAVAK